MSTGAIAAGALFGLSSMLAEQDWAHLNIVAGTVKANQTIGVVLRWDHRITDAALIARTLNRLEQVLNTEILSELRTNWPQTEAKSVRAVAT